MNYGNKLCIGIIAINYLNRLLLVSININYG